MSAARGGLAEEALAIMRSMESNGETRSMERNGDGLGGWRVLKFRPLGFGVATIHAQHEMQR